MHVKLFAWIIPLAFLLCPATSLFAQQIVTGTPFNSLNDGYFERYGIGWGLNWHGGYARFGLPNQVIPPFGKFNPSGGLQSGWRFGNGNFNGVIFLSAAQGIYSSYTSNAPFITSMNGYPGAFYDLSQSPFVTGFIPVVGDCPAFGPRMPGIVSRNSSAQSNSLDRVQVMRRLLASQNQAKTAEIEEPDPGLAMLPRRSSAVFKQDGLLITSSNSSAERPAPGIAEAKRLYEQEKNSANDEVSALFDRAKRPKKAASPGWRKFIIKWSSGVLEAI